MLRYIVMIAVGAIAAPAYAGQTTTPSAPTAAPSPVAPAKRLCRRDTPTGSLIPSVKRCYTRAEWDNLAAGARNVVERIQDDNRSRPGGN